MSQFTEMTKQLPTDYLSRTLPDRVLSICVIDASGNTTVEKWAVPSTLVGQDPLFECMASRISYLLPTQSQSQKVSWTVSFYANLDILVWDFRGPNHGNDTGIDYLKTLNGS